MRLYINQLDYTVDKDCEKKYFLAPHWKVFKDKDFKNFEEAQAFIMAADFDSYLASPDYFKWENDRKIIKAEWENLYTSENWVFSDRTSQYLVLGILTIEKPSYKMVYKEHIVCKLVPKYRKLRSKIIIDTRRPDFVAQEEFEDCIEIYKDLEELIEAIKDSNIDFSSSYGYCQPAWEILEDSENLTRAKCTLEFDSAKIVTIYELGKEGFLYDLPPQSIIDKMNRLNNL